MMTLPDTSTLLKHLSIILGKNGTPIEIISRNKFPDYSTFPVELIRCKVEESRLVTLFCKYLGGLEPKNFDHRNGVEYEAKIYAEVLAKIPLSKITYYGHSQFMDSGETIIVLEYLGDNLRVSYSTDPDVLLKAAEWIGRFHSLLESQAPAFVKTYDKQYYTFWLERFENLVYSFRVEHSYVTNIIDFFKQNIEIFTSKPQSIIHGEYYPINILIRDGRIYPVDWESAAVGAGEIDLACLIEGWDKELTENAKEVYLANRWSPGHNSNVAFEKRLLMAQLYLFFRWWPENFQKLSPKFQIHLIKRLEFFKKEIYVEDLFNK